METRSYRNKKRMSRKYVTLKLQNKKLIRKSVRDRRKTSSKIGEAREWQRVGPSA